MNVSYQDIRSITGKAHDFAYARNMVVFYLEKIAKQAKYLGSSSDIKGNKAPGHADIVKWHYLEFNFLQKKSVLVIKEYRDGKKRAHHIQDDNHFDYKKIKDKAK